MILMILVILMIAMNLVSLMSLMVPIVTTAIMNTGTIAATTMAAVMTRSIWPVSAGVDDEGLLVLALRN